MPSSLFATPDEVEVWFMSPPKLAALQKSIELRMSFSFSNLLTQQDQTADEEFKCVDTGSGCFHPQLGLIFKDKTPPPEEDAPKTQVKNFNAIDTDLVKCDKGNYFDLYCGQAKKSRPPSRELEVWIDVSTSIRQIDMKDRSGSCLIKQFVDQVLNECRPHLEVFNTSKKEIMDTKEICDYSGTNDSDRMVDWLEASKAKKVVMITDTDELKGNFATYLDKINANIKGIGTTPLSVYDLPSLIKEMVKSCKKK